jgi:hypothetical protein
MSEPKKIECSEESMTVQQFPVAKTFIQYPALRNPSLEAFFQERETTSCPASRMASIDEEIEESEAPRSPTASLHRLNTANVPPIAKEIEYMVKNTFIDGCDWEKMRSPSLDGFFHERESKSCPATRAQSFDDAHTPIRRMQEEAQACNAQEFSITSTRSRSISIEEWIGDIKDLQYPVIRSVSLEECLRDIEAKYQDLEPFDDISTKTNTPEDTGPVTPENLSDLEEETKPCAISLTNGLGLWSVGSAQHSVGNCKPCAFLWKDENGCASGTSCVFCHMCPPGEKKRRRKEKLAARTMRRNTLKFQRQQAFQGAGCYGMC